MTTQPESIIHPLCRAPRSRQYNWQLRRMRTSPLTRRKGTIAKPSFSARLVGPFQRLVIGLVAVLWVPAIPLLLVLLSKVLPEKVELVSWCSRVVSSGEELYVPVLLPPTGRWLGTDRASVARGFSYFRWVLRRAGSGKTISIRVLKRQAEIGSGTKENPPPVVTWRTAKDPIRPLTLCRSSGKSYCYDFLKGAGFLINPIRPFSWSLQVFQWNRKWSCTEKVKKKFVFPCH